MEELQGEEFEASGPGWYCCTRRVVCLRDLEAKMRQWGWETKNRRLRLAFYLLTIPRRNADAILASGVEDNLEDAL